ncbi:hypothetical protein OS493_016626 [Desmophyllum pertusum]|uniref:Protein-tyrosine sulfotransferase n=1 Tax=Desmophyllum pertusum TaxID=174260 RepID=A0A9W9ZG16_9CNID|nr:hypothetical protein OS493_016626 [Desmophyllum pertusum]
MKKQYRRKKFYLTLALILVCFVLVSYIISEGFFSTSQQPKHEESPFLSPSENLFKVYDGVETFVMFIGYPRSRHSLVGAILDAHPEIIIPHEYDVLARWQEYQSSKLKEKNLQKYVLFYDLHQHSMKQAMFGIRAGNNSNS